MSDMFRNYPQPEDYKPDNYPKHCHKREVVIMAGETTSHSFEVPFNVEEDTIDFDILYKLGVNLIITKNKAQCETVYDEKRHLTIISCTLSPMETLLFGNTTLDAKVQLRFRMKDLSRIYTEVYKIKLIDSLDISEEIKPVPNDSDSDSDEYLEE